MPRLRSITNSSDMTGREKHPDIRMWEVRTHVDGARAGEVHDVLVDDSGEPRYIDVAMTDGKHVLMPRSEVRVSHDEQVINVPGLDRDAMATLPEYDHSPESITPEYTREHRGIYQKVYRDES